MGEGSPTGGTPRRAALLARPGPARESLRAALQQAGTDLVLEDDPSKMELQSLLDASPQVVLVALDAATEEALSKLDAVLHDPAVTVLYDEAELAAARDGWEAQRWARHLAAKLHGHDDVLPPGTESDADAMAQSGQEPAGAAPENPGEAQGLYLDLEPEAWKPRDLPDPDAVLVDGFETFIALDDEPTGVRTPGPEPEPELAPAPAPASLAGTAVDMPPAAPPPARPRLTLELEALEPVSKLEGARGALLLFAGIGGPDAVRKVLADLPPDLPTPVLVSLRLDGGRYDNLVKQMARVTDLPVELAKAGDPALAGHVFVLPDDVSLQVSNGVVIFGDGTPDMADLVANLPAPQTAILLLSGSEAAHVEPVLALAAKGAFVAGQTPQGCYDPAASKALMARGGEVGAPNELATRVIAHLAP